MEQLEQMRTWARRLQDALERLTTAIREVETELAEMKAEHDPLASHIFVSRRHYRNVSDTKSGKRREMIARLSFNTVCELGFRGSLDERERLMGSSCEAVNDCSTAIAFAGNTGPTPGASKTRQPQRCGFISMTVISAGSASFCIMWLSEDEWQ